MESLLYEIYNGDYDLSPERGKDQKELDKKICDELDKIHRMFGEKFVDHLLDLEGARDDQQAFHYYREGFRLGVRLMLEVLTPA